MIVIYVDASRKSKEVLLRVHAKTEHGLHTSMKPDQFDVKYVTKAFIPCFSRHKPKRSNLHWVRFER